MDYLDIYHRRVNHMGTTTAERIQQGGIRSFEKWMAQSPHTVRGLSVERGIFFDGIIIENKDKEYSKIMYLHVTNQTDLLVGDIMTWHLQTGATEKWIILQEEKKVNQKYRTFWIVRCNYLLKWIDENGHLQSSWSYFVSSVDSKIKGNYRTWNNLITPQPNKYAEILMPRRKINRATNFIVEDESWQVIEYDHTSVPGTIYLSLTENKINLIYDDTINNIADTDKRAIFKIITPDTPQIFNVGPIDGIPNFTVTKNGKPITIDREHIQFISENTSVIKVERNGSLTALQASDEPVQLKIKLLSYYDEDFDSNPYSDAEEHKQIQYDDVEPDNLYVTVLVGSGEPKFDCYIKGRDKIRVGGVVEEYILIDVNGNEVEAEYSFTNDDESIPEPLAYVIPNPVDETEEEEEEEENKKPKPCLLKSNWKKGYIGTGKLYATAQGITFEKPITITPLW